jgi:hypothetical protein
MCSRRSLTLLVAVVASLARAAEPGSPPKVSAEMKSFDFYPGDWSCKVTQFPEGKVNPVAVRVRKILGGSWLSVRVFDEKEVQETDEFKGYDAEQKQFRHLAIWPGGSESFVSAGWEENKLISLREGPGNAKARTTMTKLSETAYSHLFEEDVGQGFQPVFEKKCTKRRSKP